MTSITIQLDDDVADALRRLAAQLHRSEGDLVREALTLFAQTSPSLPKGIGKYHSGRSDVSEKSREILRDAVKEGEWP